MDQPRVLIIDDDKDLMNQFTSKVTRSTSTVGRGEYVESCSMSRFKRTANSNPQGCSMSNSASFEAAGSSTSLVRTVYDQTGQIWGLFHEHINCSKSVVWGSKIRNVA